VALVILPASCARQKEKRAAAPRKRKCASDHVFGVPGTVTGDIWSRTELTGDWGGGVRTDWTRRGVFSTFIRRATIKA
jgi:hypothetical protein